MTQTSAPDLPTVNRVVLAGRVSADPETRTLPSGDKVVSFRLVVPRDAVARRRSKQTVDTIECSAWTAALRRKTSRLVAGSEVQVSGQLRRRFSRGSAGVISRVTVDIDSCIAAPPLRSEA